MLSYIQHLFQNQNITDTDYSNRDILKINQVATMVRREKHRMEAFVRFKQTKDELYVAIVNPDFNVLPLIIHHFKDRYADQKWLIYDHKRNYGIYYNLDKVAIISLDFFSKLNTDINKRKLKNHELDYQDLWCIYFKNVTIQLRKNSKLHTQHIPKRYCKYLIEKNKI